jgi:serine/threonine protein kinase
MLLPSSDDSDLNAFLPSDSGLRVVKQLGAGLQGRILLAFDTTTKSYVAVKLPTFDRHVGTSEVNLRHLDCQVQSILQEREALRLVDHPNIVRFTRSLSGRKSRHTYIMLVMEYASNGDLFDLIARTGPLPENACKVYMQQLFLAVQACHASGVVHRDVKPENLLFDETFTLKLCDFGLAAVQLPQHVNKTKLSNAEGTQLYMAPEITSGTPFHGPPLDMWASGVVLYIMLTGYPPFECAEAGDPWYDHLMNNDMARFWASQPTAITQPSSLAMNLISGLLQADASRRLTALEALAHPWLRDASEVDLDAVQRIMKERRRRCLELSSVPNDTV